MGKNYAQLCLCLLAKGESCKHCVGCANSFFFFSETEWLMANISTVNCTHISQERNPIPMWVCVWLKDKKMKKSKTLHDSRVTEKLMWTTWDKSMNGGCLAGNLSASQVHLWVCACYNKTHIYRCVCVCNLDVTSAHLHFKKFTQVFNLFT